MIIDPTTSMTRLKQYFDDNLPDNTLNIEDLIHMDVLTSNPSNSPLIINNDNIEIINLPNYVQSSYILKGKNLREVDLSSLSQIEFGSARLINNMNFPPISFLQDTKIEVLDLPNFIGARSEIPATGVLITDDSSSYASFRNNYWLKTVSMGNNLMNESDNSSCKFNGFWFQNNYSLVALKLNYPYVIPIDRFEGLFTTPLDAGDGYIYVPENLITSYQTATFWSRFGDNNKIKALSAYENDIKKYNDTITDSWSQIISNCNTNNYGKYSIGDTKTLYVNGMPIQMVIVAKDFDVQENGTKAPLTWMMKTISLFTRYNLGNDFNGVSVNFHNATANYRALFTDMIWNGLDTIMQNGIKPVRKYSAGFEGSANDRNNSILSIETIWPPSASELNLASYTSPYPYFNTLDEVRPNYFLGLTNLITDHQNNLITIGTRDYSNTSGNPDLIRSTSKTTKMELIYGSDANSYIIFGFCT